MRRPRNRAGPLLFRLHRLMRGEEVVSIYRDKAELWVCPRCGRRTIVYVKAKSVYCGCGRRCRRSIISLDEAKKIAKEMMANGRTC